MSAAVMLLSLSITTPFVPLQYSEPVTVPPLVIAPTVILPLTVSSPFTVRAVVVKESAVASPKFDASIVTLSPRVRLQFTVKLSIYASVMLE